MIITTRRLEPSARRGDVVDYTQFRLGGRIIVCPRCGERGKLTRYKARRGRRAFGSVDHRIQYLSWCRVPASEAPKPAITSPSPDHCLLAADFLASIEVASV